MEARNLMGNLVHYKDGHIDKDVVVDLNLLRVFERFPERFTPIQLTTDLLIKLEFYKDGVVENRTALPGGGDNGFDKAIRYENENISSVFHWEGKFYFILDVNSDDFGDNYTDKEVKYVHELQSIYYEWEDKEITIKTI